MRTPGWCEAQLDDVAEVRLGRQRSPDKAYGDNLVPYLRAANVRWDGLDLSDVKSMQFSPEEVETFRLRRDDILVVEASGSKDEVGKSALWRDELPLACLQNTLIRVRSRGLDPAFLRWHLHQDAMTGVLGGASKGIGIHHIGAARLASWLIRVPPLNEQRRIVEKLQAVFAQTCAAKARLERLPALFKNLKRSILAAAFRGDVTADWRAAHPDVETARELAARIRAHRDDRTSMPPDAEPSSQLPNINLPNTWFVALTANVGHVQVGRRRAQGEYTGELHPYVRVANVGDDRISFDDINEMEFSPQELEQYLLRPGDIVLSEGQSLDRLGQSAMYRAGQPAVCYQATLNRFRATDVGPLPEYAQLYFRFCMHTGVFRAAGSITTNIAHLTQEKLRRIPFILCPLDEQRILVDRVRGALAQLGRLEERMTAALSKLASIEQAALAEAFRGELVSQDPADEPASVLLDRIRATRATETTRPQRDRSQRPTNTAAPEPPVNGHHAANGQHDTSQDLVVAALQADCRLSATAIAETTGLDTAAVKKVLKNLVAAGQVRVDGAARRATYVWSA